MYIYIHTYKHTIINPQNELIFVFINTWRNTGNPKRITSLNFGPSVKILSLAKSNFDKIVSCC